MWAQNRLNEASVVPCTSVLDCANYPSPCWWFARTAAEGCTGREAQRHIRKRLGFRAACCRLLCDTSAQLGAVLCAVIHSFNFDHGTVRCDPDSCVELCAALFQVSWLDCCASYLTCVIATILLLLCGTYLPEHGQVWCLSPPPTPNCPRSRVFTSIFPTAVSSTRCARQADEFPFPWLKIAT
uniref:Uncharacterized protein n=1 Tax=Trypanosoma vivax (strain Y486) TaxID=1055687 RepID=G0U7J0_TRYVY|nr:hypothetical protein TVY486_1008930 [Trypanosoma vivax Y486]